MKKLNGIPASSGIVIGKAFLYTGDDLSEIPRYAVGKNQVEGEWRRFESAVERAAADIKVLHERAVQEMSKDKAEILAAHLMMLEDEDFQGQIKERLETDRENIEWIVWDMSRQITARLSAATDAYLRERAVDIADVSHRMMHKLMNIEEFSLANLKEDVILVAHDLMPSEVLIMNKSRVKGIVTDMGSRTSHTAILARAFGIPAVLGLSSASREINSGDTLVIDGASGEVVVQPGERVKSRYQIELEKFRKTQDELLSFADLPAETKDGYRVTLKANIEIPEEAGQVRNYGAEGIGLYRSEFLFLTPGLAMEEERQYQAYSLVLKAMGNLPVTIRTLDVGGDKVAPNLYQGADEKNPLLGWRAIRMCLSMPELFKTQLRAILRSSIHGNVKIMFPMISGIEELEQALDLLEEAKTECQGKGQRFKKNIEVGTMIEVPSAAVAADILAEKSAFFSIGTNDLLQYSLAVDRGNERVGYLAQPFHPAMFRFLKIAIDAAHTKGIKAAMCGEMAGYPQAVPILLGLGLDEFSMVASAIPSIKQIIRGGTLESCKYLAEQALKSTHYKKTTALVDAWIAEHIPRR
jgi:phosphotransferase system enzyme I (PtsI)